MEISKQEKEMKKLASMLALMAAIVFGAFTLASCGDDDDSKSPSKSKPSYDDFYAYVSIEENDNANPFFKDKEAEEKVEKSLKDLMYEELLNIDGIEKIEGSYYYDTKRTSEIKDAIHTAMMKLEPAMQNQDIRLDGKIVCEVLASLGSVKLWGRDFEYSQPSISFTDNGIEYYAINDSEAGVVVKKNGRYGTSLYTGDIVIPETVVSNGKTYTITAIGPSAFSGSSITSIQLPKTLTTLYNESFAYIKTLKSITLPGKLKYYKNNSGISSNMNLFHSSSITEVVIEEGVTTLCKMMFDLAKELQKVVLPSTVAEIPENCFADDVKLTDLTINGYITKIERNALFNTGISNLSAFKFRNATIEESAFNSCDNLVDINIPDGVLSIGTRCFANCKAAETATIPASVTSISNNVFMENKAMKEFHFKGEKPATLAEVTISNKTFDMFTGFDFTANGVTIYVPAASVEAYKQASVWSRYADYIKGE